MSSSSDSDSENEHIISTKQVPVTTASVVDVAAVPVVGAIAASGAIVKHSFWSKRKVFIGVMIGIVLFLLYRYKNKIVAFFDQKLNRRKRIRDSREDASECSPKKQSTSITEEARAASPKDQVDDVEEVEEENEDEHEDGLLTEEQMHEIAHQANQLCGDINLLPDLGEITKAMNAPENENEMYMPFFGVSIGSTPMMNDGDAQGVDGMSKIVELHENNEPPVETPDTLNPSNIEEEVPLPVNTSSATFVHTGEKFGKRSRKRQ